MTDEIEGSIRKGPPILHLRLVLPPRVDLRPGGPVSCKKCTGPLPSSRTSPARSGFFGAWGCDGLLPGFMRRVLHRPSRLQDRPSGWNRSRCFLSFLPGACKPSQDGLKVQVVRVEGAKDLKQAPESRQVAEDHLCPPTVHCYRGASPASSLLPKARSSRSARLRAPRPSAPEGSGLDGPSRCGGRADRLDSRQPSAFGF